MEDLLAHYGSSLTVVKRGDQIEGKVIQISDHDVTLDFGSKAEGFINKRDLTPSQLENLKLGDKISAFVVVPETESGQTLLTTHKDFQELAKKGLERPKRWQKFINVSGRRGVLAGTVMDVNKGGLLVEVDGIRGFLPSSQISLANITKMGKISKPDELIGQEVNVTIIEADPSKNRLIFSGRSEISAESKDKLAKYKSGDKVTGEIVAVTPFGLFLDLEGVEGIVFTTEISWEESDDPYKGFKVGQEVETLISSVDENLNRLNLSIRQLSQDPFSEISKDFAIDDIVKGVVGQITSAGVLVNLDKGIEGFVEQNLIEGDNQYSVGQAATFLVSSLDVAKRRINLAPFLTSTKGLIYK